MISEWFEPEILALTTPTFWRISDKHNIYKSMDSADDNRGSYLDMNAVFDELNLVRIT